MITVMTGQVVDFFDRDFRELYAISEKLNLYKELHVSPPAENKTTTVSSKVGPKRPALPATTSRFQVSLGDSQNANIKVPAHKYYNPKYALAFGDAPNPARSLQESGTKRDTAAVGVAGDMEPGRPRLTSSEKMEQKSPLPSEVPSESSKRPNGVTDKKGRLTWKARFSRRKSSNKLSVRNDISPPVTETDQTGDIEDNFEVIVISPSKRNKTLSKQDVRMGSQQTVNTDNASKSLIQFMYSLIHNLEQLMKFCGFGI